MKEIRYLELCYRLLSRMDRRAQLPSLEWLAARLATDNEKAKNITAHRRKHDTQFKLAVGDVAVDLLALAKATGASVSRRTMEVRGSTNADVLVQVRPIGKGRLGVENGE